MVSMAKSKQKHLASQSILGRLCVNREFVLSALHPFSKTFWKWFSTKIRALAKKKKRHGIPVTGDPTKERRWSRSSGWHLWHGCKEYLRSPTEKLLWRKEKMDRISEATKHPKVWFWPEVSKLQPVGQIYNSRVE